MKAIVCGGRYYDHQTRVDHVLGSLGITELAAGGAGGADEQARRWAMTAQIDHRIYPAKWSDQGRSAGPKRNARMLTSFKPDVVVAFPGGAGTTHMVKIAREAGVRVIEVPA